MDKKIDIYLRMILILRYIQERLGHYSPKMMDIYFHVSKRDLGRIQNSADPLTIASNNEIEGHHP